MTVAHDAVTAEIRLIELEKRFGTIRAVDRVSLDVRPGEFFCCSATTSSSMRYS